MATSNVSDKAEKTSKRRGRTRAATSTETEGADRSFSGICVRFPYLTSEHLKIVAQARGLSQNSLVIDYVQVYLPPARVEQSPVKKSTGSVGVCLRFPIELAATLRERAEDLDMSQNAVILTCVNTGLEAARQDETVKAAIRARLEDLQVLSE